MTPSRKQIQSEGTAGPWFYAQGVKPGEWYRETKARTRAAVANPDWPEKQRVWASLSLHTMGFDGEIAVKMERGQKVPLRQADIAREVGIPLKSVHRCVVELEGEGWLSRETPAVGPGETELQIRCYAVPREPKAGEANPSMAPARPVYDVLPEELGYWLRHLKLGIPTGEKMEEARVLAQELSDRVARFRACCKPEPAQMPLPGVSVNRATAAELKKPGPRAIEPSTARVLPESEPGSRAEPICLGARRSSNRKTLTDMNTSSAAAVFSGEWEHAAAAVQKFFPRTEYAFVAELAKSCQVALRDAGKDSSILTDRTLADAVRVAHKPGQHSAGLFKVTVPVVLENWARSAEIVEAVQVCWRCLQPLRRSEPRSDGAHIDCRSAQSCWICGRECTSEETLIDGAHSECQALKREHMESVAARWE